MSTTMNGLNASDDKTDITPSQEVSQMSLSSKAVHADDYLNDSQDVAPALHVSTTFRYSSNPDKLTPLSDTEVSHIYRHPSRARGL